MNDRYSPRPLARGICGTSAELRNDDEKPLEPKAAGLRRGRTSLAGGALFGKER
jgi:hypothetical protein